MRSDLRQGPTLEPGAPTGEGVIGLAVPNISGREWEYVKECLDSGWVSSVGAFVTRFERELAALIGKCHAVATASGTGALHLGLLVSGVGADDEVVVPALTFIAPANAVRYVGAWPAFVDVDPTYWQLDPDEVRRFFEADCEMVAGVVRNRRTGRPVRAIMAVDVLGHPCDILALRGLAEEFGVALVEDAAEALGARYRDAAVGRAAPIGCFSFNGNKIATTGGGGMLVTDDDDVAERARYLSTQAKDDPVECIHAAVGYNYRLTNVQAAIGCAQLERLEQFVAAKRRIAARYAEALAGLPGIEPMSEAPWAQATYWMYTILVDASLYGRGSRELQRALAAEGIQTRPLWQPLHLSPAHRGSFARACPVAQHVCDGALSLPCSTGLAEDDQERVIAALRRMTGA